ncbi:hypothetical protein SD10_02875 [Spirosoma radiotolerans]|uniref:Uncharacterized protein n=1 Tax=Spirosoma radiotolerans TaxID=1379870 RepID=A0A0E3ZZM7_9BACT|nr:hypothetical protein SD10_02875 [Spirosoma radiotolerans]
MLFLPYWSGVTLNVAGLGSYSIGVTTPESLDKAVFREEEQVYAKGTLTLACSHIRLFKAPRLDMEGIRITNLSLAFYDNKLFAISCDYSPALKNAFVGKHGQGSHLSTVSLPTCINRQDKPLLIGGDSWMNGDIQAVAIRVEGFNSDCRQEESDWLMVASRRVITLSSDCDLGSRPYLYDRLLDGQRP